MIGGVMVAMQQASSYKYIMAINILMVSLSPVAQLPHR